ncbi:hypothetical protein TNCV_983881 [Trichonephila clavipes]|nr:hypothetical protein TNCV_983881 [Trichonephila clavipes]
MAVAPRPAYTTQSVKQFLTRKNITMIRHPPYSSDLATCSFLFLTVKSCLRETHFISVEKVQAQTENLRKSLPKTSFQNCHQQWQHQMQKCVNTEGNDFEGDTITEN